MTSADGARCRAIGVANCRKGLARMFAKTRSNGRVFANCGAEKPVASDRLHQMAGLVEPGVLACHPHRERIDGRSPARRYAAPSPPAIASTPVAGAEIEHAPRPIRLQT